MNRRIIILLLLLVPLMAPAGTAAIQQGEMKIFAVTTEGRGLASTLHLELEPGSGKIFSEVTSLVGTTTQNAERTAVRVARNYHLDAAAFDYKYTIISNAAVVDGPSAGGAMALLTISLLRDQPVPSNVSMTGTINDNGVIGPVGGVLEKVRAAREQGIDLFMIPRGASQQTIREDSGIRSVNLLEYGPEELGVKVVEVGTIDEVLSLAHSNIETIDVNVEVETPPLFIPEAIPLQQSLLPLKSLGADYLSESSLLVKQARNSLSTTLLEDRELLNALVQTLSVTEQNLESATIAYDQNYLYSAANFSFLAKVNALLIRDVSDNPSLLARDSTLFRNNVRALREDIGDLRVKIIASVPSDKVEWHAAAMQRLSYAEVNLGKIEMYFQQEEALPPAEQASEAVDQLFNFEFSQAWYDVARDFFEVGQDSRKKVRVDDAFKNYSSELLVGAENAVIELNEDPPDDISRRLEAAKQEHNQEWYLGAGMDAVSTISLSRAQVFNRETVDLNVLYTELRQRISEVEMQIAASPHSDSYVWSAMYLDAARYFLNSADFYYAQGQSGAAVNSLQSGISLAYLSLGTFSAAEEYYNYYSTFTPDDYLLDPAPAPPPLDEMIAYYLLGLALIVVILTIVLLILGRTLAGRRYLHHYSIPEEIKNVKRLIRKMDEAYAAGTVSEPDYTALSRKYREELALLQNVKTEKSERLLEIDTHEGQLLGLRKKKGDLNRLRAAGLISDDEFQMKQAELEAEQTLVQEHLQKDKLKLTLQKAKVMGVVAEEASLQKAVKDSKNRKQRKKTRPLPKKAASRKPASPKKSGKKY